MEVVIALPLLCLPFVFPFITGQMAVGFGRKFWPWFFLGFPLPFVACIILLCLPDKKQSKITEAIKAVENDEVFDHLFVTKQIRPGVETFGSRGDRDGLN